FGALQEEPRLAPDDLGGLVAGHAAETGVDPLRDSLRVRDDHRVGRVQRHHREKIVCREREIAQWGQGGVKKRHERRGSLLFPVYLTSGLREWQVAYPAS